MESIRPSAKRRSAFPECSPIFSRLVMDKAIGNIITVVAVLLIHMLMKAVVIMNPRMIPLGLVPVLLIKFSAIRLCRLCLSMPKPSIKPPMNRKMILLAYGAVASSILATPANGNSTIGSKAVTGIGAASVIHQVIIHKAIPITLHASGFKIFAGCNAISRAKRVGPKKRPITLAFEKFGCCKAVL